MAGTDAMDELQYLTDYYNQYDEDGRLLSKHGQIEYLTTMRYVRRYLKEGMRVLEVGAGTGRYSLALAAEGFQVDAVELIQHNIDILKSKFTDTLAVDVRQGNAVDLSYYQDDTFDITLLLGPMYHLFDDRDKRRAIREAVRVTKKQGVIFAAYCMMDATIICWGFKSANILTGIQDGIIDANTYRCLSNPSLLFELYRREDIDALMDGSAVDRLHFVATDLMTNYMRETVAAMDEAVYREYLKYHFSVCERSDLVGFTHHSLDVFRKI